MGVKTKNILNILLDVFIVLFLVFSIVVLVISLSQKTGNVSHLFGYTINSVQTSSMEAYNKDGSKAKGAIFKGDMIVSKISNKDSYEIGETVMFQMPVKNTGNGALTECLVGESFDHTILVTHNIIDIVEENGTTKYRTQGINNDLPDNNLKTSEDIVAVYTGIRVSGLGKVFDFVQSGLGFFLCIILPILAFVVIQTIRVIKNFIAYKSQKAALAVASGELTEEQKRLIAEEYMKTLNTSNSPEAAPEKKPEEVEETSSEETSSESETDAQE